MLQNIKRDIVYFGLRLGSRGRFFKHDKEYVEIKCQLDATEVFFIADLIACSTCFGDHCAHHQELKSYTVVAACGISCCNILQK